MKPHRSYVLRCLPVRGSTGDATAWRFSIQRAERDARWHSFRSLDAVAAHLRDELERVDDGRAEVAE